MMFSMQRIGRSAKTPMTTAVNQALARQAKSAFGTAALNLSLTRANKPTVNVFPIQTRSLSLQALDMAAVRQIKAELMEVDANGNPDGRIDADELKALLKRHNTTFTDEEIIELGELYYAGKSGGAVSIDKFIEAIDYAAANANGDDKHIRENDEKAQHFRETGRHPLGVGRCGLEYMPAKSNHGHYTEEELDVKLTHVEPATFSDRLALGAVKTVRVLFDTATGWRNDNITATNILRRVIFLETIAAVPGMSAAIIRHFKSLRSMERDGGMLQMLLEEANNERMHLLTFVRMRDPSLAFRAAVIGGQFGFGSMFILAYIISPKFCHRFVGYVEEEACSTYTKIIKAIEDAPEGTELANWRTEQAPNIAKSYWKLGEHGTVLDLMYAVRADEAEHRDVNHLLSGMGENQINPLYDPQAKLDAMLLKYVKDMMDKNPKAEPITQPAERAA
jgi:hypothetical protein